MVEQGWQEKFSKIWLLGALALAGRKAFSLALYEFSYLVLWSVLPFALGGLVLFVIANPGSKSYFDFTASTFRNGELLVYTISTLAPTLYLVLHDPDGARRFPHKLPLSTIVMLIIVVCAALFSLLKANTVKDSGSVFSISVALTILGLCFRYLAMVYHRIRMPEMNELELRANQDNFLGEMKKHLGDV